MNERVAGWAMAIWSLLTLAGFAFFVVLLAVVGHGALEMAGCAMGMVATLWALWMTARHDTDCSGLLWENADGTVHLDGVPQDGFGARIAAFRAQRAGDREGTEGGDTERGSVTLWMAILGLALFAVLGLVLDGGRALAAKANDASVAFRAARVGAEQLSTTGVRQGSATLNVPAATSAAQGVLAANGKTGKVQVSSGEVRVEVTETVPTDVLGLIGLGSLHVSASAASAPVSGP